MILELPKSIPASRSDIFGSIAEIFAFFSKNGFVEPLNNAMIVGSYFVELYRYQKLGLYHVVLSDIDDAKNNFLSSLDVLAMKSQAANEFFEALVRYLTSSKCYENQSSKIELDPAIDFRLKQAEDLSNTCNNPIDLKKIHWLGSDRLLMYLGQALYEADLIPKPMDEKTIAAHFDGFDAKSKTRKPLNPESMRIQVYQMEENSLRDKEVIDKIIMRIKNF